MTPDPLHAAAFARLVRYLGFPVTASVDAGEVSWRDVCRRSLRADRRLWLMQLEGSLLRATAPAARRADAHEARRAAMGPPLDAVASRIMVDSSLLYYGDPSIRRVVVEAITALPAYARDVALETAVWLGVGRDSLAWTSAARLRDDEGHTRARLVVCSEHATRHIVRHEAAHLWHAIDRPADEQQAITTTGEAALLAHARDAGWLELASAHEDEAELIAEALALVWGWQADNA